MFHAALLYYEYMKSGSSKVGLRAKVLTEAADTDVAHPSLVAKVASLQDELDRALDKE